MKPKIDAKIIVDEAKAKMIAEVICSEIENSRKENDKIYRLAERCERQYAGITKYAEQNKVCDVPWEGAADYFIPMTEWIIDAVSARIMSTLFSQEPFMTAMPADGASAGTSESATSFVDSIFRDKINIAQSMEFPIKQMLKLPFAVIKYEWENDSDRMISKEQAVLWVNQVTGQQEYVLPDETDKLKAVNLAMNGYVPSPEPVDVWVSVDKELVNNPVLRYIRFADYVWTPKAKRGTRLYWEGDRVWYTLNQLNLKVAQKVFSAEAVKAVISEIGKDKSGSDKVLAQREALREGYCWFGRLPFNKNNEVDFDDEEAIEQEVMCIVDYKAKELFLIKHWEYHRLPYPDRVYLRGEFEPTENFEGRSLAMKLYMTNKELNSFHNTIMNNAWIAMQKIFVKKRTNQDPKMVKPRIRPGVIWEEDMPGDIRVLEVGDVKAIGWEMEQSLISFAERISNISIYQTGTARQTGGSKTKGEVERTIAEGNIGMDRFLGRCHEILRTICEWTMDYYIDRMPPGMERAISDEETGNKILPNEQTQSIYAQKNISPYWQPEDISGKYKWIWQGTSLNSSKEYKLAVANDLMDRYLPQPMVSGNLLSVWEILKRGLIARGEKDWQSILPSKDDIIKEMQRMQVEAQAAQAPDAGQRAIKMLISKGMPQEEAVKAVQEKMKGGSNANVSAPVA